LYRMAATETDRTPQPVNVRLGMGDNGTTEVLDGLSEGDSIVTGVMPETSTPRPASFLF
jgi:hypothetical protein